MSRSSTNTRYGQLHDSLPVRKEPRISLHPDFKRNSPRTARASLWLLALGCLYWSVVLVRIVVPCFRAQTWQQTTGVLTSSATHFEAYPDGQGGAHHLDLSYGYRVNGVEHLGTRFNLSLNSIGTWDGPAFETARQYPVGKVVPVFFDPRNPGNAVVDNTLHWNHWSMAAAAVLLLLPVVSCTRAGFRIPIHPGR